MLRRCCDNGVSHHIIEFSLRYIFDKITPFDTSKQLEEKNVAVGIVVGSVFIGLGIAVGLVIGMGLN